MADLARLGFVGATRRYLLKGGTKDVVGRG
jgi:hypothetical protein